MTDSSARIDLPTGHMPDFRSFKRHCWAFVDEHGSPIHPPPVVFSIVFEKGSREVKLMDQVIELCARNTQRVHEKIKVHREGDGSTHIDFADLEVLYSFMTALAAVAAFSDKVRKVAEFVMWTLGFRWI